MEHKISNRLGFSLATPIVVVGFLLIPMGIIYSFEKPIIGVLMALAGGFLCSSSYGVQINIPMSKYREYGSIYGIKSGKWKSLRKMPFVSILPGRSGLTVYSRSNRATTSIDELYDVCLLSKSHRRKVIIKRFRSKDDASKYCQELVSKIRVSLTEYAPVRSEKTRMRRR